MKKLALIICILMLLTMVACAADDGDLNNNGNKGNNVNNVDKGKDGNIADKVEDNIENALDDNNTGANSNNDIFDGEQRTLTGTAQGYGGEVKVTVKVNGDDIVSVEATGKDETEGVGSRAIDELPDKIAQADSTDVDGVSGATKTSDAIKQAVDNALKENKQSKD